MDGFRHLTPIEVRFRDIDMLGHVNNATYLTYVETARLQYFAELGFMSVSASSQREIAFIVAHVSCNFKQPILLGQTVVVGTTVKEMGRSSIRMDYRIEADGEVAADGHVIAVHYDYQRNQSQPLTEAIRFTIKRYEDGK